MSEQTESDPKQETQNLEKDQAYTTPKEQPLPHETDENLNDMQETQNDAKAAAYKPGLGDQA